jgi:3',5'-cyclic AMP phosphodiesterase CpdA
VRTLLHLSDIHFGRFDHGQLEPLLRAVERIRPDLVVVSGDLTQRARPDQFQEARDFLAMLPKPQIVVPGNHDVPLHNLYDRLSRPLSNYRRYITDDLEPFFGDTEVAVLGMNTARALIWKNGRIDVRQIGRIQHHFSGAAAGAAKVLVTHHPFDLPEHYTSRNLVGRARLAMKTVADCGVDLLLAGHFHLGHAGHTAVRYKTAGHSAIFVQAGTLSMRERGEPASFNAIRIQTQSGGRRRIDVDRFWWEAEGRAFVKTATESFDFGAGGWSKA